MIKKILIVCLAILSLSLVENMIINTGDSVLKDQVKIYGEANHSYIFCYKGYDKYGFISTTTYAFKVAYQPDFDDIFWFSRYNDGCLVWVEKNNKWGVFDIDSYELLTDCIYDRPTDSYQFKEVSINKMTGIAIYEAQVSIDGKKDTLQIEKYYCCLYHED